MKQLRRSSPALGLQSRGCRKGNGLATKTLRHQDYNIILFDVGRMVKWEIGRVFAVECKTGEKNINPSLFYFKDRTQIPKFYQVHEGTKDYRKNGIRVLPVHTFWDGFLPCDM